MVDPAAERADHVAVGLAVRVRRARVGVGGADRRERGGWLDPRGGQLEVVDRDRPLGVRGREAEVGADARGGRAHLLVRWLLILVAPAPELEPAACRSRRHRGALLHATRTCEAWIDSAVPHGNRHHRPDNPAPDGRVRYRGDHPRMAQAGGRHASRSTRASSRSRPTRSTRRCPLPRPASSPPSTCSRTRPSRSARVLGEIDVSGEGGGSPPPAAVQTARPAARLRPATSPPSRRPSTAPPPRWSTTPPPTTCARPRPRTAPARPPAAGSEVVDVTVPQMGESVSEGTVLEWLKKVGDAVALDEGIVEISTDKVDAELPSPVAGVLVEQLAAPDEVVQAGSVVARIAVGDGVAGGGSQVAGPATSGDVGEAAARRTADAAANGDANATPVAAADGRRARHRHDQHRRHRPARQGDQVRRGGRTGRQRRERPRTRRPQAGRPARPRRQADPRPGRDARPLHEREPVDPDRHLVPHARGRHARHAPARRSSRPARSSPSRT